MLEGEQRQALLGNLHQGLISVLDEVSTTETHTHYRPEYLSVGELSEIHINPKKARFTREEIYYQSYRSSLVPSREEIEREIKFAIARGRTEGVELYVPILHPKS